MRCPYYLAGKLPLLRIHYAIKITTYRYHNLNIFNQLARPGQQVEVQHRIERQKNFLCLLYGA